MPRLTLTTCNLKPKENYNLVPFGREQYRKINARHTPTQKKWRTTMLSSAIQSPFLEASQPEAIKT
jgi:hypothetical protein